MYNNPAAFPSVYTDLTVGPSTLFHIQGDTTGLSTPSTITLGDLQSSTYSAGVPWSSFAVDFVRIGYGQGGNDLTASQSYVDDLTINHTTPEPASFVLFSLGAIGLFIAARRRRRA